MNIALVDTITRVTDEHIGVLSENSKYVLSFRMHSRNPIKIELVDDITNELITRVNKNTDYRSGVYTYPIHALKSGNLFMRIGGKEQVKITDITLEENK